MVQYIYSLLGGLNMKESLVVKANQLIEARYDLSLNEQRIVLYAASKLDRNQKEFNYIELDINEFTELIDTKGKRYEEVRETVKALRRKEITINTDDKEYITGWLSSITFYKNTGRIKLKFDDDLVPYLLQLKEKFTRYQLKNILYLKGKYSIRFYELFKQYEFLKRREFDLQELKRILFIEGQYERIFDFKRFVLEPSIEEINKHTDINISYDDVKRGRKVIGFIFTIESKRSDQEHLYNIPELKTNMGLSQANFSDEQIIKLYELAIEKSQGKFNEYEYVRLNYLHIKDKARNKYSYLLKALEEDYGAVAGQLRFIEQ